MRSEVEIFASIAIVYASDIDSKRLLALLDLIVLMQIPLSIVTYSIQQSLFIICNVY